MENRVGPCSPLNITLTTMLKPHYSTDRNWTWCCWDPSWPLYWIVTVLSMADTNQLNEERCHQVICIMVTKYVKLRMHFCMESERRTGWKISRNITLNMGWNQSSQEHMMTPTQYLVLWWNNICGEVHWKLCRTACNIASWKDTWYKRDDMKLLPSSTSKKVR